MRDGRRCYAVAPRGSIQRDKWGEVWADLCKRFGKVPDKEEALRVLDYLEAMGLGTDEAVRAGRALWATARFFPRPADFVAVRAERDWRLVLAVADPAADQATRRERWGNVPPDAQEALASLGGLSALREARDVPRFRSAFFEAYERTLAARAAEVVE